MIFIWGALIFIIRNVHSLLQVPALAAVVALPIVVHILIYKFGPFYADESVSAIILYVAFAIVTIPGIAYEGIKDYIENKRKAKTEI
ncbi:hypothetical protein [Butyrivibrio sp. VCB2006]|uniref:hypothetical protein n=1 Tax=Butyrivibrio sp. VCB2006 TaxID=1280679 RepID=UPI0012DE374A|nr:hypothetical protein [Butyrivibrio sp. VCB2006]